MEELLSASHHWLNPMFFTKCYWNLWDTVFLYSPVEWHLGAHPIIRPLLTAKCVLSIVDPEHIVCSEVSSFISSQNSLDSLFSVMSHAAVHQLVGVHLHQVQHGQGPVMIFWRESNPIISIPWVLVNLQSPNITFLYTMCIWKIQCQHKGWV